MPTYLLISLKHLININLPLLKILNQHPIIIQYPYIKLKPYYHLSQHIHNHNQNKI